MPTNPLRANGNNNMDGWRMKEYPGAQMAYTYLMTSETFEKVPPCPCCPAWSNQGETTWPKN